MPDPRTLKVGDRIREIDESGMPWISARMKVGDTWVHHGWGISESTGWRLMQPRGRTSADDGL